jgi:hypothetical protein
MRIALFKNIPKLAVRTEKKCVQGTNPHSNYTSINYLFVKKIAQHFISKKILEFIQCGSQTGRIQDLFKRYGFIAKPDFFGMRASKIVFFGFNFALI